MPIVSFSHLLYLHISSENVMRIQERRIKIFSCSTFAYFSFLANMCEQGSLEFGYQLLNLMWNFFLFSICIIPTSLLKIICKCRREEWKYSHLLCSKNCLDKLFNMFNIVKLFNMFNKLLVNCLYNNLPIVFPPSALFTHLFWH